MFARSVTIRLKPNSVTEFNRTFEKEVLPLLQKQRGFQDEISLVAFKRSASCCNQFVGQQGRRGSLQPHGLYRGTEASGKSK